MRHALDMIQWNRGYELPGTFNAGAVGELLREKSLPWKHLAQRRLEIVVAEIESVVEIALSAVTGDKQVRRRMSHEIIGPILMKLKESAQAKLDEVLAPYLTSHPITYSHFFIDDCQMTQIERQEQTERWAIETENFRVKTEWPNPKRSALRRSLT